MVAEMVAEKWVNRCQPKKNMNSIFVMAIWVFSLSDKPKGQRLNMSILGDVGVGEMCRWLLLEFRPFYLLHFPPAVENLIFCLNFPRQRRVH